MLLVVQLACAVVSQWFDHSLSWNSQLDNKRTTLFDSLDQRFSTTRDTGTLVLSFDGSSVTDEGMPVTECRSRDSNGVHCGVMSGAPRFDADTESPAFITEVNRKGLDYRVRPPRELQLGRHALRRWAMTCSTPLCTMMETMRQMPDELL